MHNSIATEKAPKALGPYSQAVMTGNTLYASGQLGINPETGILAEDFSEQAKQVMENIGAVLHAAEMDYHHIVKVMIFLDDMGNFECLNTIYGSYFDNNPPARSCVEVVGIPKNAKVEIEFIAKK